MKRTAAAAVLVMTITNLRSAPSGVPVGTGGPGDQDVPTWLPLMAGLGLLVAAGGAVRLATGPR
jgi:hypothetical protein